MSSIDRSEGLVPGKYHVYKPTDELGTYESVNDYFVLKPKSDPGAVEALLAYIEWCRDNGKEQLAQDLTVWLSELGLIGW